MFSQLKENLTCKDHTKHLSACKVQHLNNGLILEKDISYIFFCNDQVMYKHDYEQCNGIFLLLLQQPPGSLICLATESKHFGLEILEPFYDPFHLHTFSQGKKKKRVLF